MKPGTRRIARTNSHEWTSGHYQGQRLGHPCNESFNRAQAIGWLIVGLTCLVGYVVKG